MPLCHDVVGDVIGGVIIVTDGGGSDGGHALAHDCHLTRRTVDGGHVLVAAAVDHGQPVGVGQRRRREVCAHIDRRLVVAEGQFCGQLRDVDSHLCTLFSCRSGDGVRTATGCRGVDAHHAVGHGDIRAVAAAPLDGVSRIGGLQLCREADRLAGLYLQGGGFDGDTLTWNTGDVHLYLMGHP